MNKEEGIKLIKGFAVQISIYDDMLDFLEFLKSHGDSIDKNVMITIDMKKDSFRSGRNNIAMYANGIQLALDIKKEELK